MLLTVANLFPIKECCIQRMAIPSISDGQLDRKPVSSELNKNNFGQSLKGILIAP